MEVDFVDQCVESDVEPIEKPTDVVAKIPNLVDAGIEIGFYDQLVMSDMEIVECLVVDSQVVEGDDSYIVDMDVVGMVVTSVDSLVTDVVEDLHDMQICMFLMWTCSWLKWLRICMLLLLCI